MLPAFSRNFRIISTEGVRHAGENRYPAIVIRVTVWIPAAPQ
jgi:hypothetical protein